MTHGVLRSIQYYVNLVAAVLAIMQQQQGVQGAITFFREVSMAARITRQRPVFVRVTPEEYEKMQKQAATAGMSMSRYVAAAATKATIQAPPAVYLANDCDRCGLNVLPKEFDVITCLNAIARSLCDLDAAFQRSERNHRVDNRLLGDAAFELDKIWTELIYLNDFLGIEADDDDDDGLCTESGGPL